MNEMLEENTVGINGAGQNGMSRCFFGDWPRRELLKAALPLKDWPHSFHAREETMSTVTNIS